MVVIPNKFRGVTPQKIILIINPPGRPPRGVGPLLRLRAGVNTERLASPEPGILPWAGDTLSMAKIGNPWQPLAPCAPLQWAL